MNRRPSRLGIVISLFVTLTTAGAAGQIKEPVAVKMQVGAFSYLVVPDLIALRVIAHSRLPSALRRNFRIALFTQIEAMSAEHLRVLTNAAGRLTPETKANDWAAQRAPGPRIPDSDRAIIAGLLLQTDLLEAALKQRDPSRAEALKKSRNIPLFRRKEDRIYGDLRDNVFESYREEMNVIARFQAALGGQSAEGWYKPPKARTPKEAEACLLEGMTRLAQRAKQIP